MAAKYPDLESDEVFEFVMWMLDPKAIDGALKSAIHAHGPINYNSNPLHLYVDEDVRVPELSWANLIRQLRGQELKTYGIARGRSKFQGMCGSSSAAKRIRGALKTRAQEYFQNNFSPKEETVV